jgi:hypothetical protein
MKTNITNLKEESTYALLVRSQQEDRSLPESLVSALLIGSAVVSMWFAAHEPLRVPVATVTSIAVLTQAANVAQPERA